MAIALKKQFPSPGMLYIVKGIPQVCSGKDAMLLSLPNIKLRERHFSLLQVKSTGLKSLFMISVLFEVVGFALFHTASLNVEQF